MEDDVAEDRLSNTFIPLRKLSDDSFDGASTQDAMSKNESPKMLKNPMFVS